MKPETYADNPVKTFVRQAKDYEDAGLDPNMTLQAVFTVDDTRESIEEKGVVWAGLMRQCNQVYRENIGNLFGALVRKAIANQQPLPTQEDLDEIVARYDFSGARVTSEAGMSEEERTFRAVLRARLKDLLRIGVFSESGEDKLTVQTQKEAAEEKLPAGKISVEDYEALVEAAAEGADFEFEGRVYSFEGEPQFELDEAGNIVSYENLAAVPAHCQELAEAKLAADRAVKAVKASIPQ